jgi:hypothetical protein
MSVTLRVRLNCLLACAAILAMTLAACGGSSSAPKSLPTLPTATDPAPASASPTPTATSKKAELAAAKAVVARYYSLLNNLSKAMNADGFASIMTADCTCRAFVRDIRVTAAKHQHYFGVDHVNALKAVDAGPSAVQVLVRYSSAGGGIKTDSGSIVHRGHATHDATLNFQVKELAGRWLIYRIDLLSKGTA